MMFGALISLFSAFSFSMSDILVRRGVAKAPAAYGAFITVMIGVPLFALATLLTGQIFRVDDLSADEYLMLGAAGIVHYVVGRYANYLAIGAIGAARAGPVQSLTLPYSVLIAFLFLGEGVTAGMAAGIALILIGPALMVERQPARQAVLASPEPEAVVTGPAAAPFRMRQAEGYLFATIAAVAYGSSPVLIRAALEGSSGLSILGGFVSYIAAAALLLTSLLLPSRRALLAAFEPATVRVFFGAGFFVFMAQMLRFVALSVASVAVVAALLRFTSVFTLALSWYFNRELENLTWRVVAGVVVSVVGALLLVTMQAD
jgi:drug/metabolite transporter (DMT)-like permease